MCQSRGGASARLFTVRSHLRLSGLQRQASPWEEEEEGRRGEEEGDVVVVVGGVRGGAERRGGGDLIGINYAAPHGPVGAFNS